MATFDLVLDNALLPDGSVRALGITAGRIAVIAPASSLPDAGQHQDLSGALTLPGFIDGHNHLDTTFWGDVWRPHQPCGAGFDVGERLAIQKDWLARGAPLAQRGGALIEQAVSRGTTHMRTHVEIDTNFGLSHLDGILTLRERYRDLVSIQIVALARGLLRRPGTRALLNEALAQGADVVGGLDPAGFEGDITAHLDIVFDLARRHGKGIDLHLHDGGDLGLFTLDQMAERSLAAGMQGQVVASHAYALGEVPREAMLRTAERLASAGIAIMTNAPGHQPFPPVAALRDAGVTVFAGNDDIRDAWWPYGDGDMLERAMLVGYRSGFNTDDELRHAFDMITRIPAGVLGIRDHGLEVGCRADLVVVDADQVPMAVVSRPPRRAVFKAGRLTAKDGACIASAGG